MGIFGIPPVKDHSVLTDIAITCCLLAGATLIGFGFQRHGLSEANIIIIYILAVLIAAVFTTRRFYSLILALVSVLTFNYFFTLPYFTLKAYDDDYPLTFLTMFLSAFITSSLAVRMKEQTRQASESAFRTQVLLETNQLIQKGKDGAAVASIVANQLVKLLKRDIVVYLDENGSLGEPRIFLFSEEAGEDRYQTEYERTAARWVYENNRQAGATTSRYREALCRYLAIRITDKVYGVVGIAMPDESLDSFENDMMLSILGECAMAMENEAVLREREQNAMLAKNEQLRANLLRSISHDLRTPLTSISGNAGILLANAADMKDEGRKQIYQDIYDDALWLISLVENLLSVTRLEDGTMRIQKNAELIDEVITEALKHVNRRGSEHTITVHQSEEEFLMVKVDAQLIVQVIVNIVDNAIKYTPPGSEIVISAGRDGEMVTVRIADNGEGIPDEAKPLIFDMFYVVNHGIADGRRSLGLGLALCKSIITAHGGEISVGDNPSGGAVFQFTLPREEVTIYG